MQLWPISANLNKKKAEAEEYFLTSQCIVICICSPCIITNQSWKSLVWWCNRNLLPYGWQQCDGVLRVHRRLHAIRDFLAVPKPQNIQVLAANIHVNGAVKLDFFPFWKLDSAHGGFETKLLDLLLTEMYAGGSSRHQQRFCRLRGPVRTSLSTPMSWTSVDKSCWRLPTDGCEEIKCLR